MVLWVGGGSVGGPVQPEWWISARFKAATGEGSETPPALCLLATLPSMGPPRRHKLIFRIMPMVRAEPSGFGTPQKQLIGEENPITVVPRDMTISVAPGLTACHPKVPPEGT